MSIAESQRPCFDVCSAVIWWCLYMMIMYFVNVGAGSNRVFTEGTCKLLNLVISDLVDEDVVLHSRTQAISALMFGTVALLSKPGQTLAPLIGTWVLSAHTGKCCIYVWLLCVCSLCVYMLVVWHCHVSDSVTFLLWYCWLGASGNTIGSNLRGFLVNTS